MDPNAALWVLGSIAGAFTALLGIILIAISFLISQSGREYELTKRMATELKQKLVKEFSKDALSSLGIDFPEETAKKSVKNLLLGVRGVRFYFLASIGLILYCLLAMTYVKMGVEFPSLIVLIGVIWAFGVLIQLYFYINWAVGAALDLELRWVSREEIHKGVIARFKLLLELLKPKKSRGGTKRR